MNVPPHHPLAELLASCLHGIGTMDLPHAAMRDMVQHAIREAVKWHNEHTASLDESYRCMSATLGEQIDELQSEVAHLRNKHNDHESVNHARQVNLEVAE